MKPNGIATSGGKNRSSRPYADDKAIINRSPCRRSSTVRRDKVELCFTPADGSWAKPVEAHFGPAARMSG